MSNIIKTLKFPNGDVYTGEVLNNKPNNYGTMTYEYDRFYGERVYIGYWENGLPCGQGEKKSIINDFITIENGEWKEGSLNGYAEYTSFTGNEILISFKGNYINGMKHGKGVYIKNHNSIKHEYNGEYVDNQPYGYGKSYENDTLIYDGYWCLGCYHGQGYLFDKETGDIYEGEFKENSILRGKATYVNNDVYIGEFYNNWRHGQGIMTYANNNVYSGTWVRDKKHKNGTFTTSNSTYECEWLNDKKHGPGVETTSDNITYIGTWEEDVKIGSFIVKDADNQMLCIEFDTSIINIKQ